MTTERQIDYEALAQNAMRSVVRQVLIQVAKSGLPGDHHFYIAFNTQAPGVAISKRLKEKYPEEMTIVLQHRFWDLAVQEERFEVKLTFDAIPERLSVPFAAVKVFFDPSVPYGLQFEESELGNSGGLRRATGGDGNALENDPSLGAGRPAKGSSPRAVVGSVPVIGNGDKKKPARKSRPEKLIDASAAGQPQPPVTATRSKTTSASTDDSVSRSGETAPAEAAAPVAVPGNKVVSLDSFRKK